MVNPGRTWAKYREQLLFSPSEGAFADPLKKIGRVGLVTIPGRGESNGEWPWSRPVYPPVIFRLEIIPGNTIVLDSRHVQRVKKRRSM